MRRSQARFATSPESLFAKAIDRAVEVGNGNLGPEFEMTGWHAEQADAAIEIARSYLGVGASARVGDESGRPASAADHYQVVVHVDESALSGGISHRDGAESLSGGVARSDLPIETIKRLTCDGSVVRIVEDAL